MTRTEVSPLLAALATFALAYAVLLLALPADAHLRLVIADLAGLGAASIAAAAALRTCLRKTGPARWAWFWLTVGLTLWALGEATWTWLELAQNQEIPFPSIADAFYVPAYVALLLGTLSLSSNAYGWSRARAGMDALLFAGAAAIPLWRHVLLPIFQEPSADLLETSLFVVYPMADLVLFLALGVLMTRTLPFHRQSLYAFGFGLAAMLAADIAFAVVSETAGYRAGSVIDYLWFAGFLLMAGAAILAYREETAEARIPSLAAWQNMLPVLTLIPLAVWFVYAAYSGLLDDGVTTALLSVYAVAFSLRQVVALFDMRGIQGSLEQAHGQLGRLYSELEAALQTETRLARRDSLTGTLNRQGIIEELELLIVAETPFTLWLADLDGLKSINDVYGHEGGDKVLKDFATIAATLPDTLVGRYGGDEFVMLTNRPSSPSTADLERLRRTFEQLVARDLDATAICSVSFGTASYPAEGKNEDDLVRIADDRMYQDKRLKGSARLRDQFRRADESVAGLHGLHPPKPPTQIRPQDIAEGLAGGELVVHYQPIVAFESGAPTGFEALLRWVHAVHGEIGPTELIAIAERTSLIHRIGSMVLSTATRDMATWLDLPRSRHGFFVSVNVSARQVRRAFLQEVYSALEMSGLEPHCLVLEITESAVLSNSQLAFELLNSLKAMGVRIAMDDFGIGYSSINYLRSFPFDMIKLDPTFIQGVVDGGREAVMVEGILDMAHGLGAQVVAEGIETEAHYEALQGLRFDYGQGYLFGRALAGLPNASPLQEYGASVQKIA